MNIKQLSGEGVSDMIVIVRGDVISREAKLNVILTAPNAITIISEKTTPDNCFIIPQKISREIREF